MAVAGTMPVRPSVRPSIAGRSVGRSVWIVAAAGGGVDADLQAASARLQADGRRRHRRKIPAEAWPPTSLAKSRSCRICYG